MHACVRACNATRPSSPWRMVSILAFHFCFLCFIQTSHLEYLASADRGCTLSTGCLADIFFLAPVKSLNRRQKGVREGQGNYNLCIVQRELTKRHQLIRRGPWLWLFARRQDHDRSISISISRVTALGAQRNAHNWCACLTVPIPVTAVAVVREYRAAQVYVQLPDPQQTVATAAAAAAAASNWQRSIIGAIGSE